MKTPLWACFRPLLSILVQTRIFLENPFLSLLFVSRSLLLCNISEKTNEQIPRKTDYRRKDVRPDIRTHGQAGRHRTFPTGVPIVQVAEGG